MKDIQATVKFGMENNTYMKDYKDNALEMLKESSEIKTMGSRSSNKAAYSDARATAASLADEVSHSIIYILYIF